MKKLFFAAIAALFLMSGSLNAQKTVIKMNLFSPLVKTYNFQLEQVIAEKKSLQLGFFYTGYEVSGTGFSGFGITPEMRFYLSSHGAPKGWYVAPFLRYQNFKLKETISGQEEKATLSSFGGGLILGGQAVIGKHFTLESFIGPSFNAGSVKVDNSNLNDDEFSTGPFSGFGIRFGVCIGFGF